MTMGCPCCLLFNTRFIWYVVESMLCLCFESRPKTRRPATVAKPTEVSQMVILEDVGYIIFSGWASVFLVGCILMPCTSCKIHFENSHAHFQKTTESQLVSLPSCQNLSELSTSCLLADRCM